MEYAQELKALGARFPVNEIKQRTAPGGKKLDYLSIDATIGRLNTVLGAGWSFTLMQSTVAQVGTDKYDKPEYLATCEGTIEALGKRASGVGADIATDPDKALKTALAECLKKAGHQYGVGLYLWDETERTTIDQVRQATAAGDDVKALKIQVVQLALDAGVNPTAEAMAEHFGVSREEISQRETLEAILSAA